MYDVNLIRILCDRIAVEPDTLRTQALCELLRAVIPENDEEIGVRLRFLKNKYNIIFGEAPGGARESDR